MVEKPSFSDKRLLWLLRGTGLVLALLLGIYNQPFYPTTWLDEGFALQGALNLVKHGQYAMVSKGAFRVLDQPLIANGPGIVMPIAAAFQLLGIGLLQARLVTALFLTATIAAYYAIVKRIFSPTAALISIFALLALPAEGLLLFGRQSLGMIPSFLYFLLGFGLWMKGVARRQIITGLLGGILFGLAMVTKGQYLIFVPVLGATFLAEWLYYKQGALPVTAAALVGIGLSLATWYGGQIAILGFDGFLINLEALSSSSAVTISAFRPQIIPRNLGYLLTSGILLMITPAWLYMVWRIRTRTTTSLQLFPLLLLIPVWLIWYAFVSVGWTRYAFDPYAIGAIFVGYFTLQLLGRIRAQAAEAGFQPFSKLLAATYLTGLLAIAVWGFYGQLSRILNPPQPYPQEFAAFIKESVDPGEIIESWEWEIDLLAPKHTFHHPTNDWVDKYTAQVEFGETVTAVYDPFIAAPQYLIDGPLSKKTGLYRDILSKECCVLIYQSGPYDLYRVITRIAVHEDADSPAKDLD